MRRENLSGNSLFFNGTVFTSEIQLQNRFLLKKFLELSYNILNHKIYKISTHLTFKLGIYTGLISVKPNRSGITNKRGRHWLLPAAWWPSPFTAVSPFFRLLIFSPDLSLVSWKSFLHSVPIKKYPVQPSLNQLDSLTNWPDLWQ